MTVKSIWRGLRDSVPNTPPPGDGPIPGEGDLPEAGESPDGTALETLSAVLRDYGHYSFDTDATAQTVDSTCDRWARHLLYGSECPRTTWSPKDGGGQAARDWTGVRHFVRDQRQREYAYVMRSVGGMRSAIWSFIHEVQQSLSAARSDDAEMARCLQRLDAAARQDSVEMIRREIASASASLSRMISERRTRESEQVRSLQSQLDELGSELEEARQESSLDPLTRLYNRKSLDLLLQRALDKFGVFGQPACLLLLDADHFKQVNDKYGHSAGDDVLRALADCLTSTFPRKGDVAARYGGEEFAVIAPDVSRTEGVRLAERLLAAVRRLRIQTATEGLGITVSIGVATPNRGDTAEVWLQRADRALYAAKRSGRDRAVLAA